MSGLISQQNLNLFVDWGRSSHVIYHSQFVKDYRMDVLKVCAIGYQGLVYKKIIPRVDDLKTLYQNSFV